MNRDEKFLAVLLHGYTQALVGLAALSALIWWAGPLVGLGDTRPLDTPAARMAAIAAVLVTAALVLVWQGWRRRRAERSLLHGLREGDADAAERESQALTQRFAQALRLMDQRAGQGRRWPGSRRRNLYALPWYLFIGAPGSGKTTALANAGLNFPLAGHLGQGTVRGVGGTRHCDWWFTDQAILIDTAGRYALQQSDAAADAQGWRKFLGLLRATRPRRPINGVLLTVNVQDLLLQDAEERTDHARRLRARLEELHDQLGVQAPVYVLVTKCDLLAGFDDSFAALGREEREQIWGFPFPTPPAGPDTPARAGVSDARAESTDRGPYEGLPAAFLAGFNALSERLCAQLPARLEQQPDLSRRAAMFAFPTQFAGLRDLLGHFLGEVFATPTGEPAPTLPRGVYFTSATQEGTPIDRVLGTLSRRFGIALATPRSPVGRPGDPAPAKGRSYFLAGVLRDVVFAEQDLVGGSPRAVAARRRMRQLAFATLALGALTVLSGWALSTLRNRAYVDDVASRLPALSADVKSLAVDDAAGTRRLLPVLDSVVAAPRSADFDLADPPTLNTLGLYQGDLLEAGMRIGYGHLLEHALLPRVARRLEERLRAADPARPAQQYDALKGYLMLHAPQRFDGPWLIDWVLQDEDEALAGPAGSTQRGSFERHLRAALARGVPAPVAPRDEALVARVREQLVAFPLEQRVLSRMQRQPAVADVSEFTVAAAVGPAVAQVFQRASGQPFTRGVPALYTRSGYERLFLADAARQTRLLLDEERWVLTPTPTPTPASLFASASASAPRSTATSSPAPTPAAAEVPDAAFNEALRRVGALYGQSYIRHWDSLIGDLKPVRVDSLDRGLTVARVLASADSPLPALMRAAARETRLGPDAAGGAAGGAERPAAERSLAGSAEAAVNAHFTALHRLVAGTPAPIDDAGRLFNELLLQLAAIDAAQKSRSAPPPVGAAVGAARAAAGLQPEPVRGLLEALSDVGASQGRVAERLGLSSDLRPVTDFCARTVSGRFPFNATARADVLPDDLSQLMGPGGLMDEFFQRRLAALVDTGSSPWSFRPLPDGRKPGGGAGLVEFQRASRVRDAFFKSGARAAAASVTVRVAELTGARELRLEVDGQSLRFKGPESAPQTLTVPGRTGSQIKLAFNNSGTQTFEGPWALLRLIQQHEVAADGSPERLSVTVNLDGRKARLELIASSAVHPLRLREFGAFRCPEGL
ncbi:type VI secretion system membrane subunit TssM [Roseateles amylovorans]|uniref:Type VI secretion system membrane subunit TssM n=1 Tax=Roseateles amylovorans TaxID=2978473 RepID=A0ABY6ATZ9_9BURK|nr:type VI secretion system membrane subunit TssM [Roseateles amylovorans]UXH76142.1 type VI secretion system membrane subunit TssM [Roseateles amylovorans]